MHRKFNFKSNMNELFIKMTIEGMSERYFIDDVTQKTGCANIESTSYCGSSHVIHFLRSSVEL